MMFNWFGIVLCYQFYTLLIRFYSTDIFSNSILSSFADILGYILYAMINAFTNNKYSFLLFLGLTLMLLPTSLYLLSYNGSIELWYILLTKLTIAGLFNALFIMNV